MAALHSSESATPLNLVSFVKLMRVSSVPSSRLLMIRCTLLSGQLCRRSRKLHDASVTVIYSVESQRPSPASEVQKQYEAPSTWKRIQVK